MEQRSDLSFLRYADLENLKIVNNRMTLSRWLKRANDPFPAPVQLGENTVAWRESDVRAWLDRRPRAPLAKRPGTSGPNLSTQRASSRRTRKGGAR